MSNTMRLMLTASLCVALPAMAPAQSVTNPVRVEASAPSAPSSAAMPQSGPRATKSHFVTEPAVQLPQSALAKLANPLDEGGSNTFTITTLALILGIILIVVLVAR